MDLINLLLQRRNTTVTVNGTEYRIDGNGVCAGVKDADAAKMLQNREAWVSALAGATAPKPTAKIALITKTGEVIAKPAEPAEPVVTAPEAADESEDWPDPKETMEVPYLREMADAYEVKYTRKTTAKELVKKIMVVMYPES